MRRYQRFYERGDPWLRRKKDEPSVEHEQQFHEWTEGLNKELHEFWKSLIDLYSE
ncbi:MAG: hypothetical protein V1726_07450 [Methanobacteriota archaeon]